MAATISAEYLAGIREGRERLTKYGAELTPADEIQNLRSTIRGFAASSPVGQMLRGELDFWKNQLKK